MDAREIGVLGAPRRLQTGSAFEHVPLNSVVRRLAAAREPFDASPATALNNNITAMQIGCGSVPCFSQHQYAHVNLRLSLFGLAFAAARRKTRKPDGDLLRRARPKAAKAYFKPFEQAAGGHRYNNGSIE